MHIALLPLDERPVNTRLPRQVAAVARVEVELPPAAMLSRKKQPGDTAALGSWLEATVERSAPADELVASLDTLGYGGLIAARTTTDSVAAVLNRWEALRRVRARAPRTGLHAVSLVTRAPNSNSSDEEPDYWRHIGADLHRYGAALHRRYLGEQAGEREAGELRDRLPRESVADFEARRLRNHTVNLAALGLAADATLQTLLITADDTAERSAGSLEQHWLAHWKRVLGDAVDGVLMHPGADEVGSVLVARAVLGRIRDTPLPVAVECAVPGGLSRVAPYENLPLAQGTQGHLRAVGAAPVPADADAELVVVVHPPDQQGGDWAHGHPRVREQEHSEVRATAERVASLVAAGAAVVVADCAYPNGSDPALLAALQARIDLKSLAAYGGWNTAGNTVGSALAHGVVHATARAAGVLDDAAHHRLLLHRLIEDSAYMTDIRGRALARFTEQDRHDELPADVREPARSWIAAELARSVERFPEFAGWSLPADSVRLPWDRTFEVDFALHQADGPAEAVSEEGLR
ncbi:DUF4127 family protein [Streptomyces xiaopingdaonensis]|uniref:DUF4127 family protein n=1 Tax=Streptomyces xiaopingdaonensis TaxID=1565415 RepID=UPI0002EE60EE|nr:DUF4127 family protein [Streptomyces xiaopingdaonensis]